MNKIKRYEEFINKLDESTTMSPTYDIYDKDKEFSYSYVVARMNEGPAHIKKLIPTLEPFMGTNKKGEWIRKVKITQQIHSFLFNKHY